MKCSKLPLIRPINSVMVGLGILVGQVIAYQGIPPLKDIILGFLVGFFASAGIMALNDYYDIEIDKINAPRRPIPCGAISPRGALTLSIISLLIAIGLSFLQTIQAGLFAAFTLFLDVLYDRSLKRSGFIGNVIVSYSVAAPFIYGALSLNLPINEMIMTIALMAFLSNLGREIAKGILDVEGDRLAGVKTIAVRFGIRTAKILSAILVLSAVIISILLPLNYPMNLVYFLVIPTTDLMFLYSIVLLRSNDTEKIRRSKNLMRLAMLVAMVLFIIMSLINAPKYTRKDLREKAYF